MTDPKQAAPWRPFSFIRPRSAGPAVRRTIAALTDLVDAVVLQLHAAGLADAVAPDCGEAGLALVPLGGFGRRDVAPFSDVDLMLLAAPAAGERAARLARCLTRDICDAGLQLGFCLRTPDEACTLALQDPTVFTALVEARFLAGDRRLYEQFQERFGRLARRRSRALVSAVIAARNGVTGITAARK